MAKRKKSAKKKTPEPLQPDAYITSLPETCDYEILEPIPIVFLSAQYNNSVTARLADPVFEILDRPGTYWLDTTAPSRQEAQKKLEEKIADILDILIKTGTGDAESKLHYETLCCHIRRF